MDYHNLCHGCMEEKTKEAQCPHCGLPEGAASESALHLPPGTVLQEKYLIGKALGQGGFGITYLALDMNLNLKLAIKEYLPQELAYRTGGQNEVSIYKKSLADNFNYGLQKFLEEARTLAHFNEHPNIVSVRDYFKANGTAYLVMNYIEGVTLKQYMESRNEPLPFEQVLDIFMPVLDALKEVHATGILHRDISPDNLLIDAKGRVVLIDFGAARQAMGDKSRSMSVIMKAGYSPFEQYQSKGKQGPWTDIYAVAAAFYHAITGQAPLKAIDRMAQDDLIPPSQLKIKIAHYQEQTLLKALAVKAEDRYQAVEEFQGALLRESTEEEQKNNVKEAADKDDASSKAQPIRGKDIKKEILLNMLEADLGVRRSIRIDVGSICPGCGGTGLQEGSVCSECGGKGERHEQKTLSVKIPAGVKEGTRVRLKGQGEQGLNGGSDGDFFLVVKLKAIQKEEPSYSQYSQHAAREKAYQKGVEEKPRWQNKSAGKSSPQPKVHRPLDVKQDNRLIKYSAFVVGCIVMLVVVINLFGSGTEPDMQEDNYYIDYTGGTIPLADLPIGARVVDPSWKWEYRLGVSYSNKGWDDDPTPAGEVKPVIWIVVAKNHYDGLEPHVTLLAEELIGLHAFDNSSHVTNWGYNHWGESGTHSSADRGLRPWLNSTGIHSGEGFYRTFSENFKEAILTTNVPNKEWENGTAYNTNDHVFTPSTTELGDSAHNWTYPIGTVYPYFSEENYKKRVALLGGEACFYWTRSPTSYCGSRVSCVTKTRGFSHFSANSGRTGLSSTIYFVGHGVRPALNLKSGTLVSEIGN